MFAKHNLRERDKLVMGKGEKVVGRQTRGESKKGRDPERERIPWQRPLRSWRVLPRQKAEPLIQSRGLWSHDLCFLSKIRRDVTS